MRFLILFFMVVNLFALQKVSIQLDWKYQFEFAGYIAAKEKGFYKNAGLDVKLVQYHNNDIVKDVMNGKYTFGIYDDNLIMDKLKGKHIKLIASFFKRSALVLLVDPNINKLKQLNNKTLMISNKDLPTFKEFLTNNGVNINTIHFVPTNYTITPFVNHKVNGFSAFVTDETFLLEEKGVKFNIINPSDYGFLMYQGELFTKDSFANNNLILIDRFKKATIKGWQYAMSHKKELVNIIYNKYSKRKDKGALLDEANKLENIIQRHIYPIGFIDRNLLKAQFQYEANKSGIKINPSKIVDSYIFEFENPLNLDKKYLFLVKLYNLYLFHKPFFIAFPIFILILFIVIYFLVKLQKEKQKIEKLFNQAPVAYVLMDFETRIIKQVNDFAYKLFKYPKDTNLNIISQQFHASTEHFHQFRNLTLNYIQTHKTIEGFNLNWQFKDNNGTIMWINVKALMYSDRDILWILTDINDIIKTQEKLQQQILTTQKVMQVKEEFLANMSHEIRTPLNAILGFVDIIYNKEKDEENKKYLEIISKSSKSLLTIINDILDFSKIESGKLKIEKIEFNPKDEFETLIYLFDAKAKEKNIELKINLSNLNWNLITDPTRIKQIISNFLSNAIKFTSENKEIICNVTYNSSIEKLYVEVIDEGIGISEEKLSLIFEPFSQADSSTTRKFGGTGLGLAISKNLVHFLGGELKVKSIEGKGSTFAFSIPAKKTKYIECVSKIEIKTEDMKFDAKVLVVEDNKANQLFFKVILNSLGINKIRIANDGLEAIEIVKENKFDIIFMDENMPNMNGLEATKQIKKMEVKVPIIAVTANALSGDKEKFLQVMDDYLAKPIDKDKLVEILKKYLKGKE